MDASRDSGTERQATLRLGALVAGVALLVAALVQLSLKFLLGFSWFWSVVVSLAVLAGMGLLAALIKVTSRHALENDMTWVCGNLRPLELRRRAVSSRTAVSPPPARHASHLPADWRATLSVHVNGQSFALGSRFEADKLALAGFDPAGSVARVRADALPGQTLLIARQCVVKSFGGEFVVTPLMKGDISSPVRADTTAILYFPEPDPARPFPPKGIVRITIVAAGGRNALELFTGRFADLASEMFGEPCRGSRGQRIWPAEDVSLVCEEEGYKGLHRSTFIWTTEDLQFSEAG